VTKLSPALQRSETRKTDSITGGTIHVLADARAGPARPTLQLTAKKRLTAGTLTHPPESNYLGVND